MEKTQREFATELWLEASALGNETAQFVVGVMHAWGLHGLEKDERKAILHFYFSALGGHVPAQMTLAYRHSRGDQVPLNCKTASMYGELAANRLVDRFVAEGMIEPTFAADRVLAPDEVRVEQKYNDEDLVEYYLNLASKGDNSAMGALGKIYFYGARDVERDLVRSYRLLSKAASEGDVPAMAGLAHLLLRGVNQDIPADYAGALRNFTKAAEAGNQAAYNGLGFMHLFGFGSVVPKDVKKALAYFTKATEIGNGNSPEAYYNLGSIYASGVDSIIPKDFTKAFRFFTLAAQKGSVLALHKLAHMSLHGLGALRNCKTAVQYFKAVAERTRFALDAKHEFSQAYHVGTHNPLLGYELYLRLAEAGYELAEVNAAKMLDAVTSTNSSHTASPSLLVTLHSVLDVLKVAHPPLQSSAEAFRLYERAAEQGNTRARLRVGDFWYYQEEDFQEAAVQYRIASEGANAQAHFNLAYQHHHGLGLVKDLHLAKRYYDMAYETSPDSKLAVSISLTLLWLESVQKSWAGENLVTSSSLASSVKETDGFKFPLQAWLDGLTSISMDTMLIALLLVAFFGVGMYRDRRLERVRVEQQQQPTEQPSPATPQDLLPQKPVEETSDDDEESL